MPSDQSANLALPYLAAAQAQKHVTHNEALRRLDAYVQLVLESVTAPEPPASPAEGARWFVPAGATGLFAGHDGTVAAFEAGAFDFLDLPADALAFIRDEQRFARFDGTDWISPLADQVAALSARSSLVLESVTAATPPVTPVEGARWFVPAGGTGVFAGHIGALAVAGAEDFAFLPLPEGTLAYIRDEDRLARYDGAAWVPVAAEVTADPAARALLLLESVTLTTPPATPTEGACWAVPTGATGAWSGQVGALAAFRDGAFVYTAAPAGTLALVRDQWKLRLYDGGAWVSPLAVRPTRSAIEAEVLEEDLILSGASIDTALTIPARAIVLGVSTRTLSAVTGATSYDCGIAGEVSKFGGSLGVARGSSNSGVIGPTAFYTATPVRLTANGGTFTGGRVRVSLHILRCPVSAFPELEASWWSDAAHLLDGTVPSVAADFGRERYAISGAHLSSTDVVTRSGGAKTVVSAAGAVVTAPSNALVFDYASGRRRMVQEGQSTNLVYPSAAPTAAFTLTVSAVPYTVSFWGTGAVTLSGTHSATVTGTGANTRTVYTFTPTAGSLTLTPSGSVARLQLEVASMATSYIETTTAAVTRLTDVCPWSSGAASVLSAAGPNTVVMRGSFGRPSSGNITYLAGNVSVLRSGGSGAVVFEGSTNFTLLEAALGMGLTNAGIVFGWSGSSRIGCVSGGTARTHSSSVIADLSAVYLGPATGVQTGIRNELDEIVVWPVLGTSAGVQTQAHIYTP